MSFTAYVYGLSCPVEDKIRYVGVTRNPVERYKQHTRGNPEGTQEKQRWVLDLRERGLVSNLVIFEELPYEKAAPGRWVCKPDPREVEQRWIDRLSEAGHPLTNAPRIYRDRSAEEQLVNDAREKGRKLAADLLED